jgi:sensor histidine kinase regulating citrate/malate metabolism
MFKNDIEIVREILIGSIVFVCLILLIIIFYFLYRYQQKTNLHFDQELKKQNLNIDQTKRTKEEINDLLNNEKQSSNIQTTIIEELMRKSLQLAKTAEKVADHNEKRFSLKENIHFNF